MTCWREIDGWSLSGCAVYMHSLGLVVAWLGLRNSCPDWAMIQCFHLVSAPSPFDVAAVAQFDKNLHQGTWQELCIKDWIPSSLVLLPMPEVSMADIAMRNCMFHFYFDMGGDDMQKKIQLWSFPFCRFLLLEIIENPRGLHLGIVKVQVQSRNSFRLYLSRWIWRMHTCKWIRSAFQICWQRPMDLKIMSRPIVECPIVPDDRSRRICFPNPRIWAVQGSYCPRERIWTVRCGGK